jgi:hypothetical protein
VQHAVPPAPTFFGQAPGFNLPKDCEHYDLMDRTPLEAEKHLAALETHCGNRTCEEYADLAKAIAGYKARNQ